MKSLPKWFLAIMLRDLSWPFYLVLTTPLQIMYSIDMNYYPHFTNVGTEALKRLLNAMPTHRV